MLQQCGFLDIMLLVEVFSGVVDQSLLLRLLVLASESDIVSMVFISSSEAKKSLLEELVVLFLDFVRFILTEVDGSCDGGLGCLVGLSFIGGGQSA